jgi:hypothetical protein
VISDTLFGIVAFAATAGPGYVYVRLAERREPRHDRSSLQEAAELVLVGGLATTIGLFPLARDLEPRWRGGSRAPRRECPELSAHPTWAQPIAPPARPRDQSRGGWLVARIQWGKPGKTGHIQPSDSAWYAAFRRQAPKDHGVLVTITMRDESAVTGLLGAFTVPPVTDREILLNAPKDRPLYVQQPNGVLLALRRPNVVSLAARH